MKKLNEVLQCPICFDTLAHPKLLHCNHVYCQNCLPSLVDRDLQGKYFISCPTCRQITPLPSTGVAGLPSAFHIDSILEIKKSVIKLEDLPSRPTNPVMYCAVHKDKELELYCETCGELICLRCVTRGGQHQSHEHELLDEAFERYKEEITSLKEPMEKQLTTISKALTWIKARHGEITGHVASIEIDIHDSIRRLHEILDIRKKELIGQLSQITQEKIDCLENQKEQLETTQTQIRGCLGKMDKGLRERYPGDALIEKTTVEKQARELAAPLPPDILNPNTEANIVFSALADAPEMCENYGQVLVPSLPDATKCLMTGKCADKVKVGEKPSAILQVVNFVGEPCKEAVQTLECELVSEITGTREECAVKKGGESHYEISYQPKVKGRHQLHIKIEGQHVQGSPHTVSVMSPVDKVGTPISTIPNVDGPMGITITPQGEVVVAECDGDTVSFFSCDGRKLRSFGKRGSAPGRFKHPCGVAVDGDNNIVVADSENHRIQKFTPEGQFLVAVGTKGSKLLQFMNPNDVAFSKHSGKLYVADGCHRIQILNPDLTFSSSFGKKGNGRGQFNDPTGIAFSRTGKVYVTDSNNHRIQVFTATGKFLKMFGSRGAGWGELNRPNGIAIDSNDKVYVSDFNNHRVSVFTPEGEFVVSFGGGGMRPGMFMGPGGIVVGDSGVIFVADWGKKCIQMF